MTIEHTCENKHYLTLYRWSKHYLCANWNNCREYKRLIDHQKGFTSVPASLLYWKIQQLKTGLSYNIVTHHLFEPFYHGFEDEIFCFCFYEL